MSQEINSKKAAEKDEAKSTLPEAVSAEPGATVDQEVKNIDNDLKAIDDTGLSSGMSDQELGI
ncbi:MAG: hypothetical protein ACD_15C00218G0001 [uncultured bacterium]|nr:MAG: hypothetical protein ACD_15C00218G0001 [uncultured bacterium]